VISGHCSFAVAPLDEFRFLHSRNDAQNKHSHDSAQGAPQQTKPDPQSDSYLNLVIELRRNGSFKVIKATQITGQVILPDFPTSNFVYEVTSEHMTLAIGSFPDDPFTVRGFAGPDNAQERIAQGHLATVVINVPLVDASQAAISKIHLRIIKLMSEANTRSLSSVVLARLRAEGKAVLLNDLPASKLGPAIKKKLVRLQE